MTLARPAWHLGYPYSVQRRSKAATTPDCLPSPPPTHARLYSMIQLELNSFKWEWPLGSIQCHIHDFSAPLLPSKKIHVHQLWEMKDEREKGKKVERLTSTKVKRVKK